jgi:2-dehydropantoate 2-reductase
MRIGVIGAGAVGGALAALLDRAGHEVEVTARGEHLDRIRSDGLALDGRWGEHVAHPVASAVLQSRPELAIAATKAAASVDAIAASAGALDGVPLLVVQNGLGALDAARDGAPRALPVGGLATMAVSFLSPGRISVTTPGELHVGGPDASAVRRVADVLGGVLPVHEHDDLAGVQWTKLVVNQVNALPGITDRSVQQVVADNRLRLIMTASMRETAKTGYALGVRFGAIQGLDDRVVRVLAHAPLGLAQAVPFRIARAMGSTPNPASILQSIRRGQPTEVDALNGAVVRAAAEAGREAPVNAALVELVHEVEQTGRFLGVDEVVRRVGRLR